jgi:hypothetical protein
MGSQSSQGRFEVMQRDLSRQLFRGDGARRNEPSALTLTLLERFEEDGRCPAAENGHGLDYYLVAARAVTSSLRREVV